MKHFGKAAAIAGMLALAACGGKGDDALGDNVAEAYDNKADNMDAMADNMTGNEAAQESMQANADATRDMGAAKEEAIDDADVNAAAMSTGEKNAMMPAKP